MENHFPSTFLSMDPTNDESKRELMIQQSQQMSLSLPAPDINIPLSADHSTSSQPAPSWNSDSWEILEVGLRPHVNETAQADIFHLPKICSRKCTKRGESIWGAWFFFNFYFKPILSDKSKAAITRDASSFSSFDKSDLKVDVFLVQHDMENMYMWVFKERPENALGKMQLRSYMNGHSRLGEPLFPFSPEKGFVRSHRMQRKQYRGLSNPQCIHGIEVVTHPNLTAVCEGDRKKWAELTGRDLNFSIPAEASDFGSWRTLPGAAADLDIERSHFVLKSDLFVPPTRFPGSQVLNLLNQEADQKRKKDSLPHAMDEDCCFPLNSSCSDCCFPLNSSSWINDFSGVMRHVCGPVTAAKTIYEDDYGYLIMVTLPFSDQHRVKVCWRNGLTHGIVKIFCISTARMPSLKRHDRTFKLTDPTPEHCPPGEFVREISLATRIPEDAKIEAYYDETGTVLEIMVPKQGPEPEEHEVHVSMRPPHLETNDLLP
ncbi:hypothetical protein KSP40_PGU007191 [Platanthera guangdongensis]|uniref:HSP20-like chaperones superfamily protein n=1 Tax=Platanthera guangdongensis TaxID=2320717 RepID=A0ABR2LUV5_9ASPA